MIRAASHRRKQSCNLGMSQTLRFSAWLMVAAMGTVPVMAVAVMTSVRFLFFSPTQVIHDPH